MDRGPHTGNQHVGITRKAKTKSHKKELVLPDIKKQLYNYNSVTVEHG